MFVEEKHFIVSLLGVLLLPLRLVVGHLAARLQGHAVCCVLSVTEKKATMLLLILNASFGVPWETDILNGDPGMSVFYQACRFTIGLR